MRMMKKLLENVGRSWKKSADEFPVLSISQGTGTHTMYSVEGNQLHFHTMRYNPGLPIKQTIILEELTIDELADIITSMGYIAEVPSEAFDTSLSSRKSFAIMPRKNQPLPSAVYTFTSKLWVVLYPIARLLEEADYDTDVALRQMLANSTSGRWLEYWASFFNIRRIQKESDESLRKRIFTTIANVKTNNIAIEELVRFVVNDEIKVLDKEPALMEIVTDPKYMSKGTLLHDTVMAVKGAGIDYILNFMSVHGEDYRSYLTDKVGRPFQESDVMIGSSEVRHEEMPYGYEERKLESAFRLGVDRLNSSKVISPSNRYRLKDEATFQVGYEDVFPVRREQRKDGQRYFRLNQGKLSNPLHSLYGEEHAGDIMNEIIVESAESFPQPFDDGHISFMVTREERYREPVRKGLVGFRLNHSRLGSSAQLSKKDERTVENGSMVMELNGTVVQQLLW